ncbi:hypothetical protein N8083_01740 [Candidatus Pacebacteria bacterium]|nr:hypothetical protein [Candidatus Paceibacterota bacterium]
MRKGRGEIIKIGDLFEKYRKTLVAPQRTVIETFCEVVLELLSIEITKKSVKYSPSTRILSVGTGGPLKSEIKLHRTEILAHMKGRLGEKNAPKDII